MDVGALAAFATTGGVAASAGAFTFTAVLVSNTLSKPWLAGETCAAGVAVSFLTDATGACFLTIFSALGATGVPRIVSAFFATSLVFAVLLADLAAGVPFAGGAEVRAFFVFAAVLLTTEALETRAEAFALDFLAPFGDFEAFAFGLEAFAAGLEPFLVIFLRAAMETYLPTRDVSIVARRTAFESGASWERPSSNSTQDNSPSPRWSGSIS